MSINYFNSSLTGQQIENALLASKKATSLNGIPKYDGTSGGTSSVTLAVVGVDYAIPTTVGNSAPTTSTVGTVGAFYLNSTTSVLYICTSASGGTYTWIEISGGGGGSVSGLVIKGFYATLQALQQAVPNPSVGDAYGVGTTAPYEIYIWSGSVWVDNGTLKGEKGDDGDDGEDGYSPEVTITTITGGHRVTITDADHPSGQSFDVMDGTGGGGTWGSITGTLANQTDLATELNGKVPTSTTVNGHALSSNVTIADTDIVHGESTVGATLTSQSSQIGNLQTTVGDSTSGLVKDVDDLETNKQNKLTTTTCTLAVADWSDNEQTVSVSGVTASNTIWVSPASSSFADYTSSIIRCSAQASGTLTFTCSTVPTSAITVNVVIAD